MEYSLTVKDVMGLHVSVSITFTTLTTKFLLFIFTVLCLWTFVFHAVGCYFHSVERLWQIALIPMWLISTKQGRNWWVWGGGGWGGADGTHSNRAQMTRGCSNHGYKVSLKLMFQNVFWMKQITSCKGSGFYLVYNLLLALLLFLCANWEGGGLDLRPYPGRKVCLSHLPHVSLRAYRTRLLFCS